eukprot:TRINITY_DN7878_c0_g1_i1.p1 TRINITY_DN7878_c0_g1~~TRINITY_DN7878_c0_g1_i1.p1  ORF type:complete len:692 (-),score=133.92 TRINITY_DN7878_c0_g1_i1:12-2087(-)
MEEWSVFFWIGMTSVSPSKSSPIEISPKNNIRSSFGATEKRRGFAMEDKDVTSRSMPLLQQDLIGSPRHRRGNRLDHFEQSESVGNHSNYINIVESPITKISNIISDRFRTSFDYGKSTFEIPDSISDLNEDDVSSDIRDSKGSTTTETSFEFHRIQTLTDRLENNLNRKTSPNIVRTISKKEFNMAIRGGNNNKIMQACFGAWRNYAHHKHISRMRIRLAERERILRMDERKTQIRNFSFMALAIIGVILIFFFTMYYNYVMISPYTTPILLAFLLGLPMGIMKDFLVSFLQSLDHKYAVYISARRYSPLRVCLSLILIFVVFQLISLGVIIFIPEYMGLVVIFLPAFNFLFSAFNFPSTRNWLVTSFLIFMMICFIVFPMYFWMNNCVHESTTATNRVISYLKHQNELQDFLQNYENSTLVLRMNQYTNSWGYDTTSLNYDRLRTKAVDLASTVGSHVNIFFESMLFIVNNLGNILFSGLIFLSSLFYIVENHQTLWSELAELSPLTQDEQMKIFNSLKQSVSRIFLCCIATGSLHFWVTFVSFSIAGIDLKNIFAAISAFLSTFPLTGTWLLWLPVSLYLFMVEKWMLASVVVSLHMLATYYLQPLIYSYIPGNPYYVSMSAVLGINAFGISGAVFGPLLAGILVTLFDILKSFYSADKAEQRAVQQREITRLKSEQLLLEDKARARS